MPIKSHQDVIRWHFGVQQLQDPELVSRLLQRITVACDLYGDNTYLQLIVIELMNNALDHGVLKLNSSLKAEANGFTRYYEERKRRLQSLTEGSIEVSMEVIDNTKLCLRVHDSGDGFDYRAYQSAVTDSNSTTSSADTDIDKPSGNRFNTYAYGRGLIILNLSLIHI